VVAAGSIAGAGASRTPGNAVATITRTYAADGARLRTTIWYPAHRPGPFPLLVFSQGFDLPVSAYSTLLAGLALSGFVVAAPTYPHTNPGPGLDESDILNHPRELRDAITGLLQTSSRPGSRLSGLVAPGGVGILGHSDGAEVTLAVAANSCCRDPRVKAAAVLSGAELASFGGRYYDGGSPPLLVAQGSADTINPPACSAQLYAGAPAHKYYLDLLGAPHSAPAVGSGVGVRIVTRVLTDFFTATLEHQPSALGAMERAGNVSGYTSLTHAVVAPKTAGHCPDSPP
jgi:predicted dienelactone hydrolase